MRRTLALLMATFALGAVMATTGCAGHRRMYDPYHNDYHRWDRNEDGYYRRWLAERHYNYVQYDRLDRGRQREYWDWRHRQAGYRSQGRDRDRDRDRDHDRDRH